MTPQNKRENIREELERGAKSMEAASILAERKYFSDAVSRLYYFVYHTAKALLLSEGLEPKSHEGLLRLIGMHFVKTDILSPPDSHIVTRLMKYREEADYNPSYLFTESDFRGLLDESTNFRDKVMTYLRNQGYIE